MRTSLLVLALAVTACARDTRQEAVAETTAVSPGPATTSGEPATADSCPAPDPTRSRTTGFEGEPLPRGDWNDRKTIEGPNYSIDIPKVSAASDLRDGSDSLRGFSQFPFCFGCSLSVRLTPDTAGVAAHVAGIMREEARIDSINKDPNTKLLEFNEYDGPPRIVVGRDTATFLDVDCGDCASGTFFYGRPGQRADVTYTIDDRADVRRAECQLKRVALTFRWKR